MSPQPKTSDAGDPPVLPRIPLATNAQTMPTQQRGSTSQAGNDNPDDVESSEEEEHEIPRHRFMTTGEWTKIAHGVGGIQDVEQQVPVHPRHWWWPPKGMHPGLYKDVVTERTKFFYLYHMSSIFRWTFMILQLLVGAVLTAIGSMSLKDGVLITVLGAVNTVIAGLIALLTNSGLPDRYRYDMFQDAEVEGHIKEILNSGIAPADAPPDQVLAECFDLYKEAKATIAANMPANYTSRQTLRAGPQGALLLAHPLTKAAKAKSGEKAAELGINK